MMVVVMPTNDVGLFGMQIGPEVAVSSPILHLAHGTVLGLTHGALPNPSHQKGQARLGRRDDRVSTAGTRLDPAGQALRIWVTHQHPHRATAAENCRR
jgi:hypothetical protein